MLLIRILIVLLLCLPQAFAPLVHAHVGVDASPPGLHLPGLENGSAGRGSRILSPHNLDHGIVVGIGQGVREHSMSPPFVPGLAPTFPIFMTLVRVLGPASVFMTRMSSRIPSAYFHSRAPPA